jgi:hypothetical protein
VHAPIPVAIKLDLRVGRKDAIQEGRYDSKKELSWKLPALQAARKKVEEFVSASFGRKKKIDSLHSRPNCGGAKSLKLTLMMPKRINAKQVTPVDVLMPKAPLELKSIHT